MCGAPAIGNLRSHASLCHTPWFACSRRHVGCRRGCVGVSKPAADSVSGQPQPSADSSPGDCSRRGTADVRRAWVPEQREGLAWGGAAAKRSPILGMGPSEQCRSVPPDPQRQATGRAGSLGDGSRPVDRAGLPARLPDKGGRAVPDRSWSRLTRTPRSPPRLPLHEHEQRPAVSGRGWVIADSVPENVARASRRGGGVVSY